MTRQVLNVGSAVNAGDGDSLRVASIKINDNFNELYGNVTTLQQQQNQAVDYDDLLNKPVLFSGSYNDLSNKPTLFSGSYDDLSNKPTLFSGSYNDLTDNPLTVNGNEIKIGSKVAARVLDFCVVGVEASNGSDPGIANYPGSVYLPVYFDEDIHILVDSYVTEFVNNVVNDNTDLDWTSFTWESPFDFPEGTVIDPSYDIRTNSDGYPFVPARYGPVLGDATNEEGVPRLDSVYVWSGGNSVFGWYQGSGYDSTEGNQRYTIHVAEINPTIPNPVNSGAGFFSDRFGLNSSYFSAVTGPRTTPTEYPGDSWAINNSVYTSGLVARRFEVMPSSSAFTVYNSSTLGNMFMYIPDVHNSDPELQWSPRPDGLPAIIVYTELPDPDNAGSTLRGWYYFDNDGLKYAVQPPRLARGTISFR